jgi:hypothetical protein
MLKATWTAKDLVEQLGGLEMSVVQRALQFWLDQKVLEELPEQTFRLLEVLNDDVEDKELTSPILGELDKSEETDLDR